MAKTNGKTSTVEEKDIEKISAILCRFSSSFRNPNIAFTRTARLAAASLRKAGYRKKEETIAEAKKLFCPGETYSYEEILYTLDFLVGSPKEK